MRTESKDEHCCLCLPLVFGIWLIAIFIFALTIVFTIQTLFWFFNQYYESWYVIICWLLLIPLFFGFALFVRFVDAKTYEDRGNLKLGVMLAGITVVALTTWSIFYVAKFYGSRDVYFGMGDPEDEGNY